ncbi:hypothetical protein CYMTET_46326 [Cymbomonas tetramitiformis]|uniref:Uncharacterized protein n=1 Tax=Cymbomonas tetramitiformis TaxID=36881 RepID=A0AAE0BYF8_9CHLO|nr:hypothetical protein CYMTET_46328 [Cymbomonas tetramitiformis]KAK3244050.1 hypothetical protein CYMTET_46326 [Cymbomonas tetramitiformis]
MDTTQRTAKRKLLREFDLDSSIRLVDAVRDSPTVRTPPVPAPPAPAQGDTPAILLARQRYEGAKTAVNAIYSKGRHRKWAKAIKQHALGGDYFSAKDDVSKLAKIVIALIKAEIVTAGLEPDVFDLDSPALGFVRSCRRNIRHWSTPPRLTRGRFWPKSSSWFARTELRIGLPLPRLISSNAAVGVLGPGFLRGGDEILIKLIATIDRIENIIKTQRTGGAAAILPKRTRKGMAGFRAGSYPDPHVGFDGKQRKALPNCPRCPTAGDWHKYHSWFDCPLGGKREEAGSTAAYCQPVDDCTPDVLHTLAMRQVFQTAADNGAAAFAAACEQYGVPTVVDAGAASGGVDVSAYGFAVSDSEDSDGEDMDMETEPQQMRREVSEAARGVRFNQATFIPLVSMESAAIDDDDAQTALFTQP